MGNLTKPVYRRDYTGETVYYIETDRLSAVLSKPRALPYDFHTRTAIVLGNGVTRTYPDVNQMLVNNRNKLAEAYKLTYACNAAITDTIADYYVIKDDRFFQRIEPERLPLMFTPYNIWINRRETNLIPTVSHYDAGSAAAMLAAFDGATKVFLIGFDGTDGETVDNIYSDDQLYSDPTTVVDFQKFHSYLHDVVKAYSDTQFYRVRTPHSNNLQADMSRLRNYTEVTVREAILLGDF
jgi:hypothetical protein